MANRRDHDHISASYFRVEIAGVEVGAFTAIDGLELSIDVIEFADGSDLTVRKRPGRVRYPNIVLRRGYTNSDELWNWIEAGAQGRVERRSGSIILLEEDGTELSRYNIHEGWPCRWKLGPWDARAAATVIEELEIAVERIERG